jgi:hypothetical protein
VANFPRYLTFKEGELEKTLEGMGASPHAATALRTNGSGRGGLLERHTCPVTYPDGTTGVCHYTRCAATWRVFRYEHLGVDGKATHLPSQRTTERIPDTVMAVTEAAERLATTAFREAVRNEQEFFRRATSLSGAKPTEKPQMKAKRAAQLGGQYSLCQPLGPNLLPVTDAFDTLEAANAAWEAQSNQSLVVACCCRFRRRWERPRYNPLHARADYPPLYAAPLPLSSPSAVSLIRDGAGSDGKEAEEEDSPMPGSDFAPESEEEE